MKLGFLTAALPGNTLEQAAKWGAESGFQADRDRMSGRLKKPPVAMRV